jgi:WD40 repeat protein
LDKSVILWDLKEKSRIKTISDVDIEVVYSVTFSNNDTEFLCGGHSSAIRRIPL